MIRAIRGDAAYVSAYRSVIPAMKSIVVVGVVAARRRGASKIRRIAACGALVLRLHLRPEVDALEHEAAQREHRGADLVALDDVARRGRGLDEVVDERVDPLRAGRAEQLDLVARQVAGARGSRAGSRRRCRG